MDEIFIEHLIKRKKSNKDIATIIFLIVGGLIFTPMAIYFTFTLQYLGYLFLIMLFAIWWCIIYLIKSKTVEYEYIFTNGTLDIDMIIAGGRRGRVISISPAEMERIAPIDVPYDGQFKTLNCSTKDETDDLYYIITQRHDVGTVRVLFNPTEEMMDAFKIFRPSKVMTGDEKDA